jgi:NADH-quinone oxidoreductase subunit G
MKMVEITVDRKPVMAEEGSLLIEALLGNGIEIPYFCYHEALGPDGNCRMCMVEIDGQKRPQIACDTFVKEGMIVITRGDTINKVRQDILELELINHPVDCPICDQAGECKLQDFYMDYGLYDSHIEMKEKVTARKHVDLGSNVMLDQERCVLCARCTRFTSDITKTNELGIIGRGDHAKVSTMPGRQLDNPYAMNVVDLCPVGALTSKDFRFAQRVWFLTSTPSVCHGCAKGCSIFIDHNKEKYKDEKVYRFRPRKNLQVNGHFICDEGRLSYKALNDDRQSATMESGSEIGRDSAVKAISELIGESRSTLILADPNLYLEELAALQTFARKVGAALYAPLASYVDESFGDEWLRSSQRAANAKAVEELGIMTVLPDEIETELLINVNHVDSAAINAQKTITLATHEGMSGDMLLPLAVFSESSGTMINEDGVRQYCAKVVIRNTPVPTVDEWIAMFEGGAS